MVQQKCVHPIVWRLRVQIPTMPQLSVAGSQGRKTVCGRKHMHTHPYLWRINDKYKKSYTQTHPSPLKQYTDRNTAGNESHCPVIKVINEKGLYSFYYSVYVLGKNTLSGFKWEHIRLKIFPSVLKKNKQNNNNSDRHFKGKYVPFTLSCCTRPPMFLFVQQPAGYHVVSGLYFWQGQTPALAKWIELIIWVYLLLWCVLFFNSCTLYGV